MPATMTIVYGPMGSGKTYFAVRWARASLHAKRRVFATFKMADCRPLPSPAFAWCEDLSGSDLVIDEAGSHFNARAWQELEMLVYGALTHARHQDCNVIFLVQHPMFLDSNFRRLAEAFVRVERFGPGGESARARMVNRGTKDKPIWYLPKERRPGLFKHPWWFQCYHYKKSDFTAEGEVKQGASARKVSRFLFRWDLAERYNSWNHVPPPGLRQQIEALKRAGGMLASLPTWKLDRGAISDVEVPEEVYEAIEFPVSEKVVVREIKESAQSSDPRYQEALKAYREFALSQLGIRPKGPEEIRELTYWERLGQEWGWWK